MFVKAEFFNPGASVKDRLAIGLIEHAEKTGLELSKFQIALFDSIHLGALKPGQTVVEATSGNTGISLAMVCAAKGLYLVDDFRERKY
jgi:cysteine synthase A